MEILYDKLYAKYLDMSDEELIDQWKYHQSKHKEKYDPDWIGFTVCEDILRQRENSYLDDTYPRD